MKIKKGITRAISVILCAVLACAVVQIIASAQAAEGTLKLLSFNVSGLPVVGMFQGDALSFGNRKSAIIGEYLNGLDRDIIGVQEDFNYHSGLAGKMAAFPYRTAHSGGVPAGDGLNVFSRRGIYNVERVAWEKSAGVLYGGTDRLAPKGFIHAVGALAEGVYIDLYVLHADAGRDSASIAARAGNYRQLAAHINALEVDRAVVLLGDFNSILGRDWGDGLYENLIAPAGLTDVWAQLYNGGRCDYGDGAGWNPAYGEGVDRVLYRNGGGVAFTPQAFEYIMMTDADGKTHTDHRAACAALSYTITDPASNTQALEEDGPISGLRMLIKQATAVCKDLFLIVTHLYELVYLVTGGG